MVRKTPWSIGNADWPLDIDTLAATMKSLQESDATQERDKKAGVIARLARPQRQELNSMVDGQYIAKQTTWNLAAAHVTQNEDYPSGLPLTIFFTWSRSLINIFPWARQIDSLRTRRWGGENLREILNDPT